MSSVRVAICHGPDDYVSEAFPSFNEAQAWATEQEQVRHGDVLALPDRFTYHGKFSRCVQHGTDYHYVTLTTED